MNKFSKIRITKKFYKTRNWINKRVSQSGLQEYTIFSIYAILTGVLVGTAAVLFHESINIIFDNFFDNFARENRLGFWIVIFIPTIGMLLQSLMIKISPDTAKHRGVSDVIKAVVLRGGFIKFRTTVFHFIAPVINMGFGGTVGPEGPAAQIGGGVASKLGQFLGLSDSQRRILTAAGSGAAIAAVFNSPMGGVFFAFEVILLHDFHSVTFAGLILASVSASAVARIFLGNEPTFIFGHTNIGPYSQLYLYILLGIFTGIFSVFYINYSEKIGNLFHDNILKKMPQWLAMALVGLALGVIGYFYPDAFGIGYKAINNILASVYPIHVVIILAAIKFIFVPLILSSGGFGGVFAPTLFIGAGLGYVFAVGINYLFGLSVDIPTFTLVAMGATLGGVNFIPLTSILIIFEMTRDYSLMIPLMFAVILSTIIVQWLAEEPVYIKHLEQSGLSIKKGKNIDILRSMRVKDLMRKSFIKVSINTTLPELVKYFISSDNKIIYVVDEQERVEGIISDAEMRPIITEYDSLKDFFVAADISNKYFTHLHKNDNLEYVFKLFAKFNYEEFPVVDTESEKLIGTLFKHDVITAYNKESFKNNVAEGISSELITIETTKWSQIADGYSIMEQKVPQNFVGKTLANLRLRNNYNVEVLMIKRSTTIFNADEKEEIIFPDANYVLRKDDIFVLFGADENLKKISNWK
jgi:CIC family chloride channel protein